VQVDATHGITLTIRQTVANPVYVEAWREGGSILFLLARGTADLTVESATIPAWSFSEFAPDSLFSGTTGIVYWRPQSTCANEITFELFTCYGEVQSFVYSLAAAPTPGGTKTSRVCTIAKNNLESATHRWKAALRRAEGGHTPAVNRRLRRNVERTASTYRRAKSRVREVCR
jgi:hypothetical protein